MCLIISEKSGCKPEQAPELVGQIKEQCPQLNIIGLMTIGKYDNYDTAVGINPDFKSLLDCRSPVARVLGVDPAELELSMGMSGDFEHAVSTSGYVFWKYPQYYIATNLSRGICPMFTCHLTVAKIQIQPTAFGSRAQMILLLDCVPSIYVIDKYL